MLMGGCMKDSKRYMLPIIILVMIDQFVKLIISSLFINDEYNIIGDALRFHPIQNTHLSFAGNYINFFSSMWVLIVLNIIVILVFISGYMFYKSKKRKDTLIVNIIMISGLSGCICSLIDKILWGGSLDFLQIPQLFTFDLKDCYLSVAITLFLIIGLMHNKEISVKEYLKFFLK